MKKVAAGLVLFALSTFAVAAPVTLEWDLPTVDCAGNPVAATDILELEIYISTTSIPSSGTLCPPEHRAARPRLRKASA